LTLQSILFKIALSIQLSALLFHKGVHIIQEAEILKTVNVTFLTPQY